MLHSNRQPQSHQIVSNGQLLAALKDSAGWGLIQEFMQKYEEERTQALVNLDSSDLNLLRSMHMAARAIHVLRKNLDVFIEDSIRAAEEVIAYEQQEQLTESEVISYEY